jgi:hypothetical protein
MATKARGKSRPKPAPRRERERPQREERGRDRDDNRDRDRDKGGRNGGGKSDSNLTRLGGAWKRETKKGDPMLAGRINAGDLADYLDTFGLKGEDQVPVLLLKNNYKESQKHPDFIIYGLDPEDVARRSRDSRGGRGGGGGRGRDRDEGRGQDRDRGRGDREERGDRNDLSLD